MSFRTSWGILFSHNYEKETIKFIQWVWKGSLRDDTTENVNRECEHSLGNMWSEVERRKIIWYFPVSRTQFSFVDCDAVIKVKSDTFYRVSKVARTFRFYLQIWRDIIICIDFIVNSQVFIFDATLSWIPIPYKSEREKEATHRRIVRKCDFIFIIMEYSRLLTADLIRKCVLKFTLSEANLIPFFIYEKVRFYNTIISPFRSDLLERMDECLSVDLEKFDFVFLHRESLSYFLEESKYFWIRSIKKLPTHREFFYYSFAASCASSFSPFGFFFSIFFSFSISVSHASFLAGFFFGFSSSSPSLIHSGSSEGT